MGRINLYNDSFGFIEIENSMGDDLTAINSARISFDKKSEYDSNRKLKESDIKLLKYLLTNGHWSVFDQAYMTFRIKVPLFVRSQHFRHQWKFNEISRRYAALDKPEFYIPTQFRKQSASNRQASVDDFVQSEDTVLYSQALNSSFEAYRKLIEAGVCREQARGVLPQAMYTEYIATAPLRSIIHFINARKDPHAQYEIRLLAEAMETLAKKIFPETFRILSGI